jgi:peptide/nickel transport system permease protein
MNTLLQIIGLLIVIAGLGWVFRWAGQQITKNKPFFRDMSFGVAYGYVLGAAVLLWIVISYIFALMATEQVDINKYFFFRVVVEWFVYFSIAA